MFCLACLLTLIAGFISSFPIRHTYSWYASDDIVAKNHDDTVNNDQKGATKARSQFALFISILFICLFLFYFILLPFFILFIYLFITLALNNCLILQNWANYFKSTDAW